MKKTFALLMALSSAAIGAELKAELKLDGNFSDTCGNLTIGNTDQGITWSDESVVAGSDGCILSANEKAAWNGSFKNVPNKENFAITLFVNANELPVGNNSANPGWTAQWILGGGAVANGFPKIGIGLDGQIKVSLHNVGGGLNSGENNCLTIGEWYQIGVSLTTVKENDTATSTWTLFINGEAVASKKEDNLAKFSWANMSLFEGADSCSSGRFKGYVDDMKFYNVTDAADAAALMKVEAARLIPEPTTATLSLLALAGLAARRRRK